MNEIIKKYCDGCNSYDENELYTLICQESREQRRVKNDAGCCLIDDWGDICLTKITNENFWCLMDELIDDKSGFLCNRSTILDAYTNGNLYGLRVAETESMRIRSACDDSVFCTDIFKGEKTWYLLPCFCIRENSTAVIIWTHTRARRMGFAKELVKLLHIEHADTPLPESIEFWGKCNIDVKC